MCNPSGAEDIGSEAVGVEVIEGVTRVGVTGVKLGTGATVEVAVFAGETSVGSVPHATNTKTKISPKKRCIVNLEIILPPSSGESQFFITDSASTLFS
jgi:hypothetical protein